MEITTLRKLNILFNLKYFLSFVIKNNVRLLFYFNLSIRMKEVEVLKIVWLSPYFD
jgi:hypothetical protein